MWGAPTVQTLPLGLQSTLYHSVPCLLRRGTNTNNTRGTPFDKHKDDKERTHYEGILNPVWHDIVEGSQPWDHLFRIDKVQHQCKKHFYILLVSPLIHLVFVQKCPKYSKSNHEHVTEMSRCMNERHDQKCVTTFQRIGHKTHLVSPCFSEWWANISQFFKRFQTQIPIADNNSLNLV